jgi:D-alanyl-D-alanine carboxypeptidase
MTTEATARGLASLLYRVTEGEQLIASGAIGTNVTGVPVEQSLRFRNGNVAFTYMGTLLLLMAEAGEVGLDDPVSKWLPDRQLPEADAVTLEMLVRNTSGYADYVKNDDFVNAFEADPFRDFTEQELLDYGLAPGHLYPPGTAWSYAHTNYLLLGAALQSAGGKPLGDLLTERVIIPMGLTDTTPVLTPLLPDPSLHTFSAERGKLEESTYWNPSWQTARGAVLATTICDMVTSARAIGTGELLTPQSATAFLSDDPVEHQPPPAGCPATACRQFPANTHYGLGVIVQNGWIFQTPLFAGQGSLHAYLPDQDLAVAIVAVTGANSTVGVNHAQEIWKILTNKVTPDHAIPTS